MPDTAVFLEQTLARMAEAESSDPTRLADWLDALLSERDRDWVATVPEVEWGVLAARLAPHFPRDSTPLIASSIVTLAHRIAADAQDAELLRVAPELETYDSPFLALFQETDAWLKGTACPDDTRQIDVLIEQCKAVLERVERRGAEVGTSVDLGLALARLAQQLRRFRQLVALIDPANPLPARELARLFITLIEASDNRTSVRALLGEATGRLARRVAQFAGRTGEHYVADDAGALFAMFRSAAGAGVIVAGMALLKIQLMALHLAPLQEALVVSLDYAAGFVVIYLLGFTIATKQPAMTASLFAHAISQARGARAQQTVLNDFASRVWRAQSVAILGNLALAFATACGVAALAAAFGGVLVDPQKAALLLAQIDPFASAALIYAAVAGVGLFLAGIVSGYYDNQCVYRRLPERLARLAWPARLLGARGWTGLADFIARHYGGIMGNLFFGFYLGLVGAFGHLAGLPLDIRHIAFAAANFGFAWGALDWNLTASVLAVSAAGVLLIGFVNLSVSFSLACYVALRATRVSRRESGHLLRKSLWAILAAPLRVRATARGGA